jgi:hypothetical protein
MLVAALACAAATPAHATKLTIKKSMWGPAVLDGRSQFPIYSDLGVGLWQDTLSWADIAPTRPLDPTDPADPAYQWPAGLDAAIADASQHGVQVSLMLITSPPWANGDRESRWAPNNPQDFADFAAAAARRYPAVKHWMIWSEPTKGLNFQPLTPDHGRPLHGAGLRGPHKYAQILDDSYAALKSVSRQNLVIGGNTFTIGTVAPLFWVKALKLPNGKRPRMDLWGHNAFSARPPKRHDQPLGSGYADFNDLDRLENALDRAFKHAPLRREHHLKIFISEYTLPTDHPNWEFNFYVKRKTQASWLRKDLHIVRTEKRIYTFGYLSLYDDTVRPSNDQVERGLITRSGEHKPGYDAFRNG